MKDENGIDVSCENCRCVCKYDSMCLAHTPPSFFRPTSEALEARIAELQNELYVVQESERAEAQEADKLRGEIKGLETKLTETVKLLGERSRECGELEALLEVKNRSDMSTQSTDATDVSKKIREIDMSNIWWR